MSIWKHTDYKVTATNNSHEKYFRVEIKKKKYIINEDPDLRNRESTHTLATPWSSPSPRGRDEANQETGKKTRDFSSDSGSV